MLPGKESPARVWTVRQVKRATPRDQQGINLIGNMLSSDNQRTRKGATMAAPYDARVVAQWFLAWTQLEDEAALSNLKLQKLLYYAQGHYMASHDGKALFSDEIQAWAHGPVVPAVYHQYKQFGSGPIGVASDFDFDLIDDDAGSLLTAVWDAFGSRTAWKLREMTHQESPWVSAFDPEGRGATISRVSMIQYFGGLYAGARAV